MGVDYILGSFDLLLSITIIIMQTFILVKGMHDSQWRPRLDGKKGVRTEILFTLFAPARG